MIRLVYSRGIFPLEYTKNSEYPGLLLFGIEKKIKG